MRKKNDNRTISAAVNNTNKVNCCPRCGSTNISYQIALQEAQRSTSEGCFLSYFIIIFLLLIPVIGWILLFLFFNERKKVENVTYALCNNCGNSWMIPKYEKPSKRKKIFKIILISVIVALILTAIIAEICLMISSRQVHI